MAKTIRIEVQDQNPVGSLQGFFKALLGQETIDALLVPQHLPTGRGVMPTLVTDPEKLEGADPLAPVFPINAAKVVSKLTRKPLGARVAVVLRSCEIRAVIELVKLKQGSLEELVVVGVDCLGTYNNTHYSRFAGGEAIGSTLRFYRNLREQKGTAFEDVDLSTACQSCEHPVPENTDLLIGVLGADLDRFLYVTATTAAGETLLDALGFPGMQEPEERNKAAADLIAQRTAARDRMFQTTGEETASLEKLMHYLSHCVNCYNCRVACPVCYCKECVFVTDVFDHEPAQYLRWARRKGILKMPTDTVFYHLTRMAHMSTACVGCGQCSNACPNNVPVMELFRTIAHHTQQAFHYEAGRSLEEPPPLSTFHEKEFSEVTGGKD